MGLVMLGTRPILTLLRWVLGQRNQVQGEFGMSFSDLSRIYDGFSLHIEMATSQGILSTHPALIRKGFELMSLSLRQIFLNRHGFEMSFS